MKKQNFNSQLIKMVSAKNPKIFLLKKQLRCVARFGTKRLKMAFECLAKTPFYLVRMR